MNAEQILNELFATQTNDPAVIQLGQTMVEYTNNYKNNQISKGEYLELVQDLATEHVINLECADLAAKERLNMICNAVISAASMLA